MSDEIEGVILARIVITRAMSDEGIIDHVVTESSDTDPLGLADALGMMRLAEDTLIRSREDAGE